MTLKLYPPKRHKVTIPKVPYCEAIDAFDLPVKCDNHELARLLSSYGLKEVYSGLLSGMWISFKGFIAPHIDEPGKSALSFCYIGQGAGNFGVLRSGKINNMRIETREAFLFDARMQHYFVADKGCRILVADVEKGKFS